MKKLQTSIATAVTCGLIALTAGAAKYSQDQSGQQSQPGSALQQTVIGTVDANKGANGDVQDLRLRADDGKSYAIQMNSQARQLADQDGKKVEITGTINGNQLQVMSFRPADQSSGARTSTGGGSAGSDIR